MAFRSCRARSGDTSGCFGDDGAVTTTRASVEVQPGCRAAPAVVRSRPAAPVVRRQCACGAKKRDANAPCACGRAGGPVVARVPGHSLAGTAIHGERGLEAVRGLLDREPGEPLARGVRDWAEAALGRDLGDVRIHASRAAAQTAHGIDASAYTVGQHVVFAAGAYAPGTGAGRQLLAHELAHTLQQGRVSHFEGLSLGGASDPAEREAEAIAARATTGTRGRDAARPTATVPGGTVARARTGQEPQPGPSPEPRPQPEEDKCANYEKDRDSMAWSIARHMYRSLGRSWPGIGDGGCKDGKHDFCPIQCELKMNDGLIVSICYNPAENTASSGLIDESDGIRRIIGSCDLSYRCPDTWKIEFSGGCQAHGKKGNQDGA
jgi:hypothetical protein